MQTLPLPRLTALLRAASTGYYATEAAAELLIAHGVWLNRRDFLVACVVVFDATGTYRGSPANLGADIRDEIAPDDVASVGVWWEDIPRFLDTAACSGSEARILRLVAELAGIDTGIPLDELLTGLDTHNSRLVLTAIADALRIDLAPAETDR
jgi:hypothetical protein